MGLNNWKPSVTGGITLEDLDLDAVKKIQDPDDVPGSNEPLMGAPGEGAPEAVIETDMRDGASTDTTLNDDEIKQMPTWVSKINLIEEDKNTLVDMLKVREDIETGGQMNQGAAETIDATFESFITPTRPLNGFTRNDSRVGLQEAKKFMDRKIRESLESLGQKLEDYAETEVPNLQAQVNVLKEDKAHCVYTAVRCAVSEIRTAWEKLKDETIVLPLADGVFVNVLNDPMSHVDINQVPNTVPLTQEFKTAFAAMQKIWCDSSTVRDLANSFRRVYEGELEKTDIEFGHFRGLPTRGLFLRDIAISFTDQCAEMLYENILSRTAFLNEGLEKETQAIKDCQPGAYKEVDFIESRTTQLANLSRIADDVNGSLDEIADFTKALACVLCCLAKLN